MDKNEVYSTFFRYNTKGKENDLKIVRQGIKQAPMTGRGAPAAKAKPTCTIGQPFKFDLAPDTSGMAKPKIKKPSTISTAASVRPILPKPAAASCLLPQPGTSQPLVMATQPPVLPQTIPANHLKRKLPSLESPVVPW